MYVCLLPSVFCCSTMLINETSNTVLYSSGLFYHHVCESDIHDAAERLAVFTAAVCLG